MPDAWRRDAESAWIEVVPGVVLEGAGDPDANGVRGDIVIAAVGHTEGWDAEERAFRGVVEIAETAAPAGLGVAAVTATLADVDGVPTRAWAVTARTVDEARAVLRAQAEAEYAARLAVGFPVPSLGEGETLQLRNEHDRTNWLALKDSCNDAIAAGLGGEPCPLPIRTTANVNHALTFADAAQLMRDLRAWGSVMMGALWAVKAAIDAAETIEALEAIDLAAGYPEA